MLSLAFWKKQSGNLMNEKRGLTADDIKELQNLQEGDRLIIWLESKNNDRSPDYRLKVYKQPKE